MASLRLALWSDDDLALLERGNAPEMTEHLGGPETDEQVRARHAKYLRLVEAGTARMFRLESDGVAVGSIGWWPSQWGDREVVETGWFVLPEFQGRGFATEAVAAVVADVRAHSDRPILTAYPSVENLASNAVCRKAGFAPAEEFDDVFRDTAMRFRIWWIDVTAAPTDR